MNPSPSDLRFGTAALAPLLARDGAALDSGLRALAPLPEAAEWPEAAK